MRYPPIFHAPDDGDDPQGGESPKRPRASDLAAQYHNDAMRVSERLAEVLDDNFKLREKNRTLTGRVADLEKGKPAEGALVLDRAQAEAWTAYQALGDPATLKTTLEGAQTARGELATLKRGEAIRAAAEAQGYKAATLAKLPSLAGKDLIVKDVEIDGKKAKQAFVAADGKEHPLAEFVTQHDPEFLPALTADAAASSQSSGTSFVRQGAGAPPAPRSPAEAHSTRTYKGVNTDGTNRR